MGKFVDNVIEDTPASLRPVIPPNLQGEDRTTKQVIALDVEGRSDHHAIVLGFELKKMDGESPPIRLLALSPPAAVLLMRRLQEEIEQYLGTSLGGKD